MLTHVRKPLNGLLRTPMASALLNRLASPRRVDDYLELIDGSWSLDEIRARVIEVRRETREVTSLWLRPNENWRGHRAGQHVQLTVTVDGVRRMRSFSLSHAPAPSGALRLTVKARDGGCVSRFLHEGARVGGVVALSEAQGTFVLPERVPDKLLFVSGGSGLTPLVAMAQQLVRDGYHGSLIWLHSERDVVPLVHELRAFARQLPDMQLHVHHTSGGAGNRHVNAEQLAQLAPDWQQREAFVCGPRGLMTTVKALFAERGLQEQVHSESFQPEWQAAPVRALSQLGVKSRLVFAKSKLQSDACAGVSLLEQAEHVGLRPLHGCRMGICKTCLCTKLSGSVRNELTGEISDARCEEIQLCIHTPLGDVSLDL
jgi:ferredoxin-NADP reductase